MQIFIPVINKLNPSKTLSFGILQDGTIVNAFIGVTSFTPEGYILNEIFTLEGALQLSYIDDIHGNNRYQMEHGQN